MTCMWKKGKKNHRTTMTMIDPFIYNTLKIIHRHIFFKLVEKPCETLYCKIKGFPLDMTSCLLQTKTQKGNGIRFTSCPTANYRQHTKAGNQRPCSGYCLIWGGPAIMGGRMPPGPIIIGPMGPIGGRIPATQKGVLTLERFWLLQPDEGTRERMRSKK